jgi:hypothetical protein
MEGKDMKTKEGAKFESENPKPETRNPRRATSNEQPATSKKDPAAGSGRFFLLTGRIRRDYKTICATNVSSWLSASTREIGSPFPFSSVAWRKKDYCRISAW